MRCSGCRRSNVVVHRQIPITKGMAVKTKKGTNQFGEALAYAIPVRALVWKCSVCGRTMPLDSVDEPPKRCSNRKGGCGKLFHNKDLSKA